MDNEKLKTVSLTEEEREEICFALRRCYCDYDDNAPESWNRGIKKYNDMLDQIIEKVK